MGVHSKAVKSTSRLCPTCTSGTSHRDRLLQSPLSTQSPLSILAKSDSAGLIPQVPTHQAPNPRYQPGFRAVPPPTHQPNPHSVCKTPLHVDFARNNHARAPRAYINTVTPRTAATPHPLLFSPRMRVCCTFFHPLTLSPGATPVGGGFCVCLFVWRALSGPFSKFPSTDIDRPLALLRYYDRRTNYLPVTCQAIPRWGAPATICPSTRSDSSPRRL
jgi:hypothetical protein